MCEILALEKSTVSRNLTRLIKNDFLLKNTSRELIITENGKSLLERIIPSWLKAKAEVAERIGQSGQEALDTLITKITTE